MGLDSANPPAVRSQREVGAGPALRVRERVRTPSKREGPPSEQGRESRGGAERLALGGAAGGHEWHQNTHKIRWVS